MKKKLHPGYYKVKVIMTNGEEYFTRSTLGKEGEVVDVRLDVDPFSHPAWTGGTGNLRKTGQMEKFANKYGNFAVKKQANA